MIVSVPKYFLLTARPRATSLSAEYFLNSEMTSLSVYLLLGICSFEPQKIKPENTHNYIRMVSNLKFNNNIKSMF